MLDVPGPVLLESDVGLPVDVANGQQSKGLFYSNMVYLQ